MVKHKIGDLFEGNVDIIAHQVNCQGKMGSGVARQVRERFKNAYTAYKTTCTLMENATEKLLGSAQVCKDVFPDGRSVFVANLFAQDRYGYDGKQYTDYDAFRKCLAELHGFAIHRKMLTGIAPTIGMPFRIGCDRGGGDWNTVYRIIEDELGDFDITLYELPKK